jgi:[acyl-carrier-protein] S-malonyltransferase
MTHRAPPLRAVIVCPGRGSYGRAQLGSLLSSAAGTHSNQRPAHARARIEIIAALDRFRAGLGRPALTELDGAAEYAPRLHVAGEHASLLTFACTAADLAAIDRDRIDVVGVTGNSMGFYTALHAAGALELLEAARLVETLGAYQAGRVIGGQLVYPLVDDDWRPSPPLHAAAAEALRLPGVHVSIRLGGAIVLGADDAGLARAADTLPPLERGGLRYPLRLPLHSAFHTPLMAETSARARADLADLAIRSPSITLIAGDGTVFRPWADPAAILRYTLGPQITEPFDLERAIGTAVGELGPDAVVLPGPGDNLGGAIAQILIGRRWRGLRDRRDFLEAQAGERPIVLGMSRPAQRARVA